MSKSQPTRRAAGSTKESRTAQTQSAAPTINAATAKQLAAFVLRLERLDEQHAKVAADYKDDRAEVLKEALGLGFDAKEIDAIVKMRRKDPDNAKIKESLRDVYLRALQLDLGELGKWARDRELAESSVRTQAVVATAGAQTAQIVDVFTVAHDLDGAEKARERLAGMVREDGGDPVKCTVSINGGPQVPVETVERAVKRVKPGRGGGVIDALQSAVAEELASSATAEAGA